MLSKEEFIKQYKTLTSKQRKSVKQFHEEKLKLTICPNITSTARKCLAWIQVAESQKEV